MKLKEIPGGVCSPSGFLAAGITAGIKASGKPDLALLVSDRPSSAAGVFSQNLAAAAPVLVSRDRIRAGSARGVVVNSGCANACTGAQGLKDALEMADWASRAAGIEPAEMLVCSTGLIGSRLPMEKVRRGIESLAPALGRDDEAAMYSIMTTDSRPKRIALQHEDGWSIGGMAKGAGMIAPNMATMLAFITSDALVSSADLSALLQAATAATFNCISIDGEASTNDTVLAFANGSSGLRPSAQDLGEGLWTVCRELARMIVADGEGATKIISVRVSGAGDEREARLAAIAVGESILVKTAVFGEDANWGRVVAALGNSGARFELDRLSVSMAGVTLFEGGAGAGDEAVSRARASMAASEIELKCDLGAGAASAEMLSSDLSPEYVKLNAAYES